MKILLFLVLTGTISFIQLKRMTQVQGWRVMKKDVFVYLGLMGAAACLSLVIMLGWRPPSPVLPLETIFENIGMRLLKKY